MDKVMVCLKRVVDFNVRIRVKPDGSDVVTEGLKMSINPNPYPRPRRRRTPKAPNKNGN